MFLDEKFPEPPANDATVQMLPVEQQRLRHWCNWGDLALTDEVFPNVMTISFCIRAFNKDCDSVSQRGQCFDSIYESSKDRKVRNTIRKRQPRSLTMLHEFVYIVRTPKESEDAVDGKPVCMYRG